MRMSGGARVTRAAAAAIRTQLLAPLSTPDLGGQAGWFPRRCRGVGTRRLERGTRRGSAWFGWRPPAPPPSAGAAPGGRAGHRLAPAAAAAAADPAPGPGAF